MSVVQVKGKDVELDEDGFLVNPDDWNNDMVEYLKTL